MVEFTVYKGSADRKIVESKTTKEVKPDEVLIKVTHSGVCGTDEHYKGADMVLGHEGAGVVEVRQRRKTISVIHLLIDIRKSDPQSHTSRKEILWDGDINTLLAVTASNATLDTKPSARDDRCMDLPTLTKARLLPMPSGRQTTSSRSQTPFHVNSLPLSNVEEQLFSTSSTLSPSSQLTVSVSLVLEDSDISLSNSPPRWVAA